MLPPIFLLRTGGPVTLPFFLLSIGLLLVPCLSNREEETMFQRFTAFDWIKIGQDECKMYVAIPSQIGAEGRHLISTPAVISVFYSIMSIAPMY